MIVDDEAKIRWVIFGKKTVAYWVSDASGSEVQLNFADTSKLGRPPESEEEMLSAPVGIVMSFPSTESIDHLRDILLGAKRALTEAQYE